MKKKPKYRKGYPEELDFIRKNYLDLSFGEIARRLDRSDSFVSNWVKRLGLVIPEHIMQKRIEDARFKKGQRAYNKGKTISEETRKKLKHTWFKKGSIPANTLPVGATSIRWCKKGVIPIPYRYIKTEKGMRELHRHNWEKAHGPIPRGKVITFIDGDSMNCDIENLVMISQRENMKRNSFYNTPERILTQIRRNLKLIQKLNKQERMNIMKLNEKLFSVLEKLEEGKLDPAISREMVKISNAINSNGRLMVEVAKLSGSPEGYQAVQKLSGNENPVSIPEKKEDLWTRKTEFSRHMGYKSAGEALATMGKAKFEKAFSEYTGGN